MLGGHGRGKTLIYHQISEVFGRSTALHTSADPGAPRAGRLLPKRFLFAVMAHKRSS